jgi:CheY-like chemotaxis protein
MLSRVLATHASVVGETEPERALSLLLDGQHFDAVLCDVMMPGTSGIDLHERVARDKPELARRFVFITGGTYTSRARDYLARIPNPRLQKPFVTAQIIAAIDELPRDEPT